MGAIDPCGEVGGEEVSEASKSLVENDIHLVLEAEPYERGENGESHRLR